MSLLIELAAFVGGAMSEYAQQKRWGSLKIFTVTFSVFSTMVPIYFLIFPSAKGYLIVLSYSAVLGIILGVINVLLIRYAIRRDERRLVMAQRCEKPGEDQP